MPSPKTDFLVVPNEVLAEQARRSPRWRDHVVLNANLLEDAMMTIANSCPGEIIFVGDVDASTGQRLVEYVNHHRRRRA